MRKIAWIAVLFLLPKTAGATEASLEMRVFSGSNWTHSFSWMQAFGAVDLRIAGTFFDTENRGAIAGTIRRSKMNTVALGFAYHASRAPTDLLIWAAIEQNSWHGLVRGADARARDDRMIPSLGVEVRGSHPRGDWSLGAAWIRWPAWAPTTVGESIRSFGDVVALYARWSRWIGPELLAWLEGAVLLEGWNAFDATSGNLRKQPLLRTALRYRVGPDTWLAAGFANDAGATPSTRFLAAPEDSSGLFLRISFRYGK